MGGTGAQSKKEQGTSEHGSDSAHTQIPSTGMAASARSTGTRENRTLPLSSSDTVEDPDQFDKSGHWITPPEYFIEDTEDRVTAGQLSEGLRSSLDTLPDRQRQVVTLRDVEGLDSQKVCELLDISEVNQRVLLHRGRSRIRQDLELGKTSLLPDAKGRWMS